MKLIQRLESQSHTNLAQNPEFSEKINQEDYVKNRDSFSDLSIPKIPEDLLRLIVESQDQTYIDQNVMP